MRRARFLAFLREFPWLTKWAEEEFCSSERDLFDPRYCEGIHIKRIDENLLNLTPNFYGVTGSLVSIGNGQSVRFVYVDEAGETRISSLVKDSGTYKHNEAYRDDESWKGETILEGLQREGISPSSLVAVVWRDYGYNIRDHHSGPEWTLTIYKPSKSLDIAELMKREEEKALAEVKAEKAEAEA